MWFQYMRKTIIAVFCVIKDYKHSRTPPLSLFGPRPITDHILVAAYPNELKGSCPFCQMHYAFERTKNSRR